MKKISLLWQIKGCLALIPLTFAGGLMPQQALASPLEEWQQPAERTVRGKVTNEDGEGLPGVTVRVQGTSRGTVTDLEGNYSISVPEGGGTLLFSFVGYVQQEVEVNNRSTVDVSLEPDLQSLEEVVVVGYGTQKRSDVTGALSSVSGEEIQERPVNNVLEGLQGKAAGVNISTNIRPGEVPSVQIRGNRSINASNDPLYVVDGMPMVSALGVTSFSINDINPNDIASVEILKDASATAIYGSRGANGVILITTKRGSKGKVTVNYSSTVSSDWYKSLTNWMDGGQYIDRWRQSLINGRNYQDTENSDLSQPADIGYPDPFLDRDRMALAADQVALESVWNAYEWEEYGVTPRMRATTEDERAMGWPAEVPVYNSANIRNYDWIDEATRTGITQNHQLSLSSGTEASQVYLSLGYYNQLGVQRDQDFERFTVNLNGDVTPNDWLTVGASVMGSLSNQNYGVNAPNTSNTGSKDLFSRATNQFPFAQPTDENGDWIRNPGGNLNLWNPLIDIDQVINERRSHAVMANMFSELKFTPWLRYRINFGGQLRNFRSGSWNGPESTNHLNNRPNLAGYSTEENFSWVVENLLYIDHNINDIHNLGITLLQSSQQSRRENINANVSNTIYPTSMWYDLASNTVGRPDGYGSGFTENTLQSYMVRANYSLMDKYLLTASGRWDGASVLAPGHKWDFFPSFALAWKMQEEGFLQGVNWINELKPRLGYGVTGNSSVPPYTTTGPLSRNPYVFGDNPAIGYLPQLVQNPLLGWEKTAQWNLGLDYTLINARIAGSIEVYESNTSDLLFQRTLPAVSGYVQKWENIGRTRNRGVELTLSTVNIERGDFSWNTDLNFASNREEIVELIDGKEDMLANRLFIGHPTQVFFHYENDGIWQNTPEDLEQMQQFNEGPGGHNFYPGTIKVVDQPTVDTNGDGIPDEGDMRIDAEDYVIRGTSRPRWTGGITNTFRYKGWSLSSFAYARVGQTYFGGYPNSYGGVWPNGRVENDMWSWDNPGGRWPMPIMGAQVDNYTPAMQFHSGSFVTVRHITLGYDFPREWLDGISVNSLQLNLQVLNPFIFGGEIVQMGLNPDDETNWDRVSQPNSNNSSPLGGTNNNTILPQSLVFTLRANF